MINKRIIHLQAAFKGEMPKYTKEELTAIQQAMDGYAVSQIKRYREREISGEVNTFWELMLKLTVNNAILFMRHKVFLKYQKIAILRANTEGYKMYVVRSGLIKYQVISTLQYKIHKRIRVFDKDLTAKELERVSSFVAFPKGSPGAGATGFDIKETMAKKTTNVKRKKNRNLKKHHNNQPKKNPNNSDSEEQTQRADKHGEVVLKP